MPGGLAMLRSRSVQFGDSKWKPVVYSPAEILVDSQNLGENPYCRSANVNSELPAATATYCRPPTE